MRSTLDLGVTLKAFSRAEVGITQSIFQVFSLFTSFSPTILLQQPFDLNVGFGVDAGVLFSLDKVFSIGIVGRNLYAPVMRNTYSSLTAFTSGGVPVTTYGSVPLDLSAGILIRPRLGVIGPLISDLKIALDYSDILDFVTHPATATNPVLHPGLGIEMVMLKILSLRGGFGHGYFSAGLGLDLAFFRLNLAMYGTELSSEPGLRPAYNLLLGLEFRY